jgi:hypothetical protein
VSEERVRLDVSDFVVRAEDEIPERPGVHLPDGIDEEEEKEVFDRAEWVVDPPVRFSNIQGPDAL